MWYIVQQASYKPIIYCQRIKVKYIYLSVFQPGASPSLSLISPLTFDDMQARCSGLLFVPSLTFCYFDDLSFSFICSSGRVEFGVTSEPNDCHFNVLSICKNLIISLMCSVGVDSVRQRKILIPK